MGSKVITFNGRPPKRPIHEICHVPDERASRAEVAFAIHSKRRLER